MDELETLQDKWLYLFRHLHELESIPARLQERILMKAFEAANIAKLDPEQRQAYEDSLKYYRDLKNVTDTAYDEGLQEGEQIGLVKGLEQGKQQGLEEGKKKAALRMLAKGMDIETVADLADLPVEVVKLLL